MDTITELKRNSLGLQVQIILSALLLLVLGLVTTWMVARLFGWTSGGGATLQTVIWIVLAIFWAGGSLKLWFNWRVKRYEIGADTIIVHAKLGTFGSSQTVYRYESIISIRMTQGFLGKQFGYGDIRITMPKLDRELVMNDIDDPPGQLQEIRRRMDDRSRQASPDALIN